VNEPTHFARNGSESLIDLVITDSPGFVKKIEVQPPLGSNHASIYLEYNITYSRDKNYHRHVWDYDKGDFINLNDIISDYTWDNLLASTEDISIKADLWSESFLGLCKDCIPNRDIHVKPRDLPWITHECKYHIRCRNRLYKRFRRSKDQRDEILWKNKAREVRVVLNMARLKYRIKVKESLCNPQMAAKKYWSLVKRIYGSKKGMGIPVLEVGDDQLCTSTDKANAFTKYFGDQQTIVEPIGHLLPVLTMLTDKRLCNIQTSRWKWRRY
jgi:hypothetical protein